MGKNTIEPNLNDLIELALDATKPKVNEDMEFTLIVRFYSEESYKVWLNEFNELVQKALIEYDRKTTD